MGPSCAGKTTLINELKYDKPHYFEHVLCFTDRPYIFKNEAEWVDYLRPMGDQDERFFSTGNKAGEKPTWLFNYETEITRISSSWQSMGGGKGIQRTFHTGVKFNTVLNTQK